MKRKHDFIYILIYVVSIFLVLIAFFHLVNKITSLPAPESNVSEVVQLPSPTEELVIEAVPLCTVVIPTCTPEPEPEPEPSEWVCPLTDYDVKLLAKVTEAEAGDQSEYGKRLVIDTILNRMDSDRCPDSVKGVVFQKNQYSVCRNGAPKVSVTEEMIELVLDELKERTNYDVVFFRTKHYHKYGTPLFQEGDHYFSTF